MDRVFEIFEEILAIPRESGRENKIAEYIAMFAQKHNLEYKKDAFNNVFLKKNNNSNKTIILQAHSDMVCVSNIDYDFENKGIEFYIDDDFYRAKNTSLGADDGIGVAIILAMLEENENMPNIEVMITSQEETTMLGAMNFDYSLLSGKTLISLDGIKEADIEASSAGMCSLTIKKDIEFESNSRKTYKLSVTDLAGGHSGDDINKKRCNAIKLIFKLLKELNCIELIDVYSGEKDNVIPNNGVAIFVTEDNIEEIKYKIDSIKLDLSEEDKQLKINIEECTSNTQIKNSKEIIQFINELEDGLLAVFEDDNFPLLSSNIGKIALEENEIIIKMSIRSAEDNKENKQLQKVKDLCDKYNFVLNIDAKKPLSPYKESSPIRELLSDTYKELYNETTTVKKIHACMEMGVISNNIENLDICTIAPTITDCHTVNEKVSISSIKRVYEWLKITLQKYNV